MCRYHTVTTADFSSSVSLDSSQAVSKHLHLDWSLDFVNSIMRGYVDISCQSQSVGACILTLDSRDLDITNVHVQSIHASSWSPVKYEITDSGHPVTLGRPVTICLPDSKAVGETYIVRVEYSTTSGSSALQWLTGQQTNSGKYPFLFSQCQAIHARSMIPCQDLCQVKVTYSANIRAPSQLTVVMSALRKAVPPVPCEAPVGIPYPSECDPSAGWSVTHYNQPVPIPAYLIAIAVGELDSRRIGPRTTVWAEPDVVDKAAWEFADTEKMIVEAEKLCGPYRFGTYDILVLNRGFPYGGMENVNLTFVTPTLLAGDRSQVAVIAHELAHSWSGNLVTNKTWTDFWINEGLTVFTETKIVRAIFGEEAAHVRLEEGWNHLKDYVEATGEKHNFTKLCPEMNKGDDPDDSFSVVPYEKGASLFWYLESLVGKARFEPFVVKFFDFFAFKTVSSQEFAAFVQDQLNVEVDWTALFSAPGMPSFKPSVDMRFIREAHSLANEWLTVDSEECAVKLASRDIQSWTSGKKCIFIASLMNNVEKLHPRNANLIATNYGFLDTNCEVRCAFISLWLRIDADTAKPHAVKLATEQGRMKFTRPMYKELFRVDPELARSTFWKFKKQYHPICAKMVMKDLNL